jgi:hypothetical protein
MAAPDPSTTRSLISSGVSTVAPDVSKTAILESFVSLLQLFGEFYLFWQLVWDFTLFWPGSCCLSGS